MKLKLKSIGRTGLVGLASFGALVYGAKAFACTEQSKYEVDKSSSQVTFSRRSSDGSPTRVDVSGADAKTFSPIVKKTGSTEPACEQPYGKDKRKVFFRGREIKGANPRLFEMLDDQYSTSGDKVFFEDTLVPGVSSKNFSAGGVTNE